MWDQGGRYEGGTVEYCLWETTCVVLNLQFIRNILSTNKLFQSWIMLFLPGCIEAAKLENFAKF